MKLITSLNAFKKNIVLAVFMLFTSALSINAYSQVKIAAIETDKVLAGANIAIEAQKKLKKETDQRNQVLDNMFKQGEALNKKFELEKDKLTELERKKRMNEIGVLAMELEQKQAQYAQELAQIKNTELGEAFNRINGFVRTYAMQEKIQLLVSDPAYVSDEFNITTKVIDALNQKK